MKFGGRGINRTEWISEGEAEWTIKRGGRREGRRRGISRIDKGEGEGGGNREHNIITGQ